ncbi:putative serine/threonine-protein kinase [Iris pallida]|uniref:[RNA-polymerase]-subunit kinase n=1 Tax=Iris pallida TaxID=29817 RepID=A0AAX6F060_IRIPA|nr:putative serine/threonine-protein kinase [Iris pallida]
MKQLLSGLKHCHNRGVLHCDIKGSDLLLDNEGILKIVDFGLASTFNPDHKQSMTSRVVTLWYRPPELLLGATYYGIGVDLWSAGCILGELLSGKPILPGRTEVEQLHKIFKLCRSPGEKYWKKAKLRHATMFKLNQAYKHCAAETFKDFSPSALLLIETLLAVDPAERGTATAALNSEFFSTEPYACEPSTLPYYPPSKELDAILRDEKARRQRRNDAKGKAQGRRKARVHDHLSKAVPAPEANAELQVNLNRWMMARMNVTTQSEKFPPPHQDGAVRITTASFVSYDTSFSSSLFEEKVEVHQNGPRGTDRKNEARKKEPQTGTSRVSIRHLRNSSIGLLMDLKKSTRIHRKNKDKELEVFGADM